MDRVRRVLLFRPDDRFNLHQMLPPMVNPTDVERIKGFRYPSPGSATGARVPTRESEDQVYDTNFYPRDPRNLKDDTETAINASQEIVIGEDFSRLSSAKRKINLLPFDGTGLRATKTANWGALDAVLEQNAAPDHLPHPVWLKEIEDIELECERKGIPYLPGRRQKYQVSANYNEVRW